MKIIPQRPRKVKSLDEKHSPLQESDADNVANFALRFCASCPFLSKSELAKSAFPVTGAERMGEICPRETRIKKADRATENMMNE